MSAGKPDTSQTHKRMKKREKRLPSIQIILIKLKLNENDIFPRLLE